MQTTKTKPIAYYCKECGGTNVVRDAVAEWNEFGQCWDMIDVQDYATCHDCGAEGDDILSEGDAADPTTPVAAERRKEENQMDVELIFDNGGGITLQTDSFVHSYDDAQQVARDALAILNGDDTSLWEGNEPECRIDPTDHDIRNGGYRVMSLTDFAGNAQSDASWRNVCDFQAAYSALLAQGA